MDPRFCIFTTFIQNRDNFGIVLFIGSFFISAMTHHSVVARHNPSIKPFLIDNIVHNRRDVLSLGDRWF